MNKLIPFSILILFALSINLSNAQSHKKNNKNKHSSHVLEQKSKRPIFKPNLPTNHSIVKHKNHNYHYSGGSFYVFTNNQYRLTYPRRGVRIQRLPVGYRTIVVGGSSRYYYNGIFYNQIGNEYEVIDPPLGSIVPQIPIENSTVILIAEKSYYQYNSILFEPVMTPEGTQYRVIEKYND